jgi:hypothetical protein
MSALYLCVTLKDNEKSHDHPSRMFEPLRRIRLKGSKRFERISRGEGDPLFKGF